MLVVREGSTCAPFNDVCNSAGKHLQSFRHLQRHHLGFILTYVMDCLVYFERVVGG